MGGRSIEKRGNTWYLRWRVPRRYRSVERLPEINRSLQTSVQSEALARAELTKSSLRAQWDARLAGNADPDSRAAFDGIMALARSRGVTYRPAPALAAGDFDELIRRLDRLEKVPSTDPAVAAELGGVAPPRTLVSEFPHEMERIHAEDIAAKNEGRQLREWRNKWKRATNNFVESVGDKPIPEITKSDARRYRDHWKSARRDRKISTQYINKQIGYMENIVRSYHEDLGIEDFENPFSGMRIEKTKMEGSHPETRSPELPPFWIRSVLLNPLKTKGLCRQALGIAVVSAELGGRAAEVYDLPPDAIRLDAPIPHIRIQIVEHGEHRREIKNRTSTRSIPLVGNSLDVMFENPEGFPRYRGKASYSVGINGFFRKHNLFPGPEYTIRGLRHSFESRLRRAGVDNDEIAQLMGHSLKRLRGREVYGDETDLKLRALYAEMIAFPTANWKPRSVSELQQEVNKILEAEGFRLR